MYFIYVDESGDPGKYRGITNGNSQHYILSGIIVEVGVWNQVYHELRRFRGQTYAQYGLSAREEIHANELIRVGKTKAYLALRKSERLAILRAFMVCISEIFMGSKIINVCIHKPDLPHIDNFQKFAWTKLLALYDHALKNVYGNDKGAIVSDEVNDPVVKSLVRNSRIYSPNNTLVANELTQDHSYTITENIVEDLFTRSSKHSYFIQAADCVAHSLYRNRYPKGSLKKYGVDRFFEYLKPLLLEPSPQCQPTKRL